MGFIKAKCKRINHFLPNRNPAALLLLSKDYVAIKEHISTSATKVTQIQIGILCFASVLYS